jgi:mannose-6-phosphate isomerase-like protein (cupin superfamily)
VNRIERSAISHHDLGDIARQLPQAWKSSVIARIGEANLKLTRMDAATYPQEIHDYAEVLLVVGGQLNLRVADRSVTVCAGELYVVPAGVPHSVEAGSAGALLIIDL